MAPPGKVIVNSSTPDSYGRILPRGIIYYDPPHGELIGAEYEIMGADTSEDSMWQDPERYQQWKELIGDEGEEGEESQGEDETEETEEDGEELAPSDEEGEGLADYEGGGGGDGSYAPGGFGPPPVAAPPPGVPVDSPAAPPGIPGGVFNAVRQAAQSGSNSFSRLAGAVNTSRPAPTQAQIQSVARAVASFKTNLKQGNPNALAALKALQRRSRVSPAAARMTAVLNRRNLAIRGDVSVGGTVSHVLSGIVKTVLSPIGWGVRGVGTISNEVGTQLNNLSRKL